MQALTLTNLPTANILASTINENQAILLFPCITVAYAGEAEGEQSEMTGTDDIAYPFRVRIMDRCSPDDNTNRAQYQLWKQQCMICRREKLLLHRTAPAKLLMLLPRPQMPYRSSV